MINAVILEDEEMPRNVLQGMLAKYCPDVRIIATEATVTAGVAALRRKCPDLLFLDVELKDGDCFEVLRRVQSSTPAVVFTTAHSHYAIQAIKFAALDYLLKPFAVGDLKDAVGKVRDRMQCGNAGSRQSVLQSLSGFGGESSGDETLALPTLEGYVMLAISNIIKMAARGNYTVVYSANGETHTVCRMIGEYEHLLNAGGFFRVHKTSLINLRHVRKYYRGKGGYVVMSDGSKVDVAARKRDVFLQRLNKA